MAIYLLSPLSRVCMCVCYDLNKFPLACHIYISYRERWDTMDPERHLQEETRKNAFKTHADTQMQPHSVD